MINLETLKQCAKEAKVGSLDKVARFRIEVTPQVVLEMIEELERLGYAE